LIKNGFQKSTTHPLKISSLKPPLLYDGDGGRVKKVTSDETVTYIGSSYEIEEASGITTTKKHIFLGSTRICTVENDGTTASYYYYHQDHIGSSNVITDETGAVVNILEYTPYGEVSRNNPADYSTDKRFTGKIWDSSTELYFYGARYYDPTLGRFITADPTIQHPYDPQDLCRYAYARNNPIRYIDPTGHSWKSFWKKVGGFFKDNWKGIVGGLVGGLLFAPIAFGVGSFVASTLTASAATSFAGGFLIGAAEFGVAGFGAGFGSGFAQTEDFRSALESGAWGALTGAITGGLIEGSYLAGWQDVLHGLSRADVVQSQLNKISSLVRSGRLTAAHKAWNQLKSQYDMLIAGARDITDSSLPFPLKALELYHTDLFASTTSGDYASIGFDFIEKGSIKTWAKVLTGQKVQGWFRPADDIISGRYNLLVLKSLDSTTVNKAVMLFKERIGQTGYYQLYGRGWYHCQHGTRQLLNELNIQ
jgi:RHS repeat-associated protein